MIPSYKEIGHIHKGHFCICDNGCTLFNVGNTYILKTIQHLMKCEQDIIKLMNQMFFYHHTALALHNQQLKNKIDYIKSNCDYLFSN